MDYQELISIHNLFQAWGEFKKGKRSRIDVQNFERNLEDNLFMLHLSLNGLTYRHGTYNSFYVQDPKLRHIHKAAVNDRVIHHLLYKYLYNLFDKTFIYDSYSCRLGKGTHKGVVRLEKFTRKVSKNYTSECWALKCDIKKFFASVDQKILMRVLTNQVKDPKIIWLLKQVVDSFQSENEDNKGIPLGNLTSQVFANIYMNKLDQFIKHKLNARYYLRYADDFLILSSCRMLLQSYINPIQEFLRTDLKLELHPKKIIIRHLKWGIDFLGYIVLPHYRLPRTKTGRRIVLQLQKKINQQRFNQSLQSYLGYLSHAHTYKFRQRLLNDVFLNSSLP